GRTRIAEGGSRPHRPARGPRSSRARSTRLTTTRYPAQQAERSAGSHLAGDVGRDLPQRGLVVGAFGAFGRHRGARGALFALPPPKRRTGLHTPPPDDADRHADGGAAAGPSLLRPRGRAERVGDGAR